MDNIRRYVRCWFSFLAVTVFGLILRKLLRWRTHRYSGIKTEEKVVCAQREDHFIKIGQTEYHYVEYPAQGKNILFIHGFASSTYTWEKVAPILNTMGYHAWALDIKGFGWSDKPMDSSYDILTLTEEVYQWLEAMDLDEVMLVGNSLGGGIATLMALLHPEKVGRLILIDAAAYDTEYPFIMKMARLPFSEAVARFFFCRWVVKQTLCEVYYHKGWITDDQVEAYYSRLLTDNALEAQIAVVKFLEFARVETYVNRIPEIRSKALIIWGEHDRWIPLSSAYRFESELKDSTLVIIPACGHMPQEEYPDLTGRLIDSFLQDRPVEVTA